MGLSHSKVTIWSGNRTTDLELEQTWLAARARSRLSEVIHGVALCRLTNLAKFRYYATFNPQKKRLLTRGRLLLHMSHNHPHFTKKCKNWYKVKPYVVYYMNMSVPWPFLPLAGRPSQYSVTTAGRIT